MKKIFTLVATALLVAAPALFTSCDDDPWYDDGPWYGDNTPWWYGYDDGRYGWNDNYYDNDGNSSQEGTSVYDEAEILQGEWDGKMTYTNGDTGEKSSFYANMTFVRNNSNAIKGTGTEVDYVLKDDGTPDYDNTKTLKFNWYIDEQTGNIYIKYITQNQSTFVMDASATQHAFKIIENESFYGYMLGTNNNDMIYIDLNRVQNNSAKKLTRATTTTPKFIGSASVTPVSFGTQSLTTRR